MIQSEVCKGDLDANSSRNRLRELLNKQRRALNKVEVCFICEKDVWNDPRRQYVSLYNAVLGPKGALALFQESDDVERFLINHGKCLLAAAAEEGIDDVVALDGKQAWIVSREQVGGGSIRYKSKSEILRTVRDFGGSPIAIEEIK